MGRRQITSLRQGKHICMINCQMLFEKLPFTTSADFEEALHAKHIVGGGGGVYKKIIDNFENVGSCANLALAQIWRLRLKTFQWR